MKGKSTQNPRKPILIPADVSGLTLLLYQLDRVWDNVTDFIEGKHDSPLPGVSKLREDREYQDVCNFVVIASAKKKHITAGMIANIYNKELKRHTRDPFEAIEYKENYVNAGSIEFVSAERTARDHIRKKVKYLVECGLLIEETHGREKVYFPSSWLIEYLNSNLPAFMADDEYR